MIAWSEVGPAFTVPAGAVDIYQSIQRLEPGAWVAAHTHDGPESGVVVSGTIARHEAAVTREFAIGATFCTPGGAVHATGNPGAIVAEAITLHVVRAGSAFSTPCACETAPPPQPGSSNPARSIVRGTTLATANACARHARFALTEPVELKPQGTLPIVVTVLAGRVAAGESALEAPAFAVITSPRPFASQGGPAEVLLTRFEAAAR
jgi:hypothetical protein